LTFFFALIAGYLTGFACKTGMFRQPDVLFKDDDHIANVTERYPASYQDLAGDNKEDDQQ